MRLGGLSSASVGFAVFQAWYDRGMRVDRASEKSWRVYIWCVFLSLSLAIVDWGGWSGSFRSVFEAILVPISYPISRAAESRDEWIRQIKFAVNGAKRIVDLERQVAEYAESVSRVRELERENAAIRMQLGSPQVIREYVVARVVSVQEDYLIIIPDKMGEIQGGENVFVGGALVGVVSRVGARSLRVTPISQMEWEGTVRVIPSSGEAAEAVLRRDGQEGVIVDGVPGEYELTEGMIVEATGADDKLAGGSVVGRVGKILSDAGDVFGRARVEFFVQVVSGDVVFVERRSGR